MHTDGAVPRWVVDWPKQAQRDYELMSLVLVCCSLLHWFKPGRAVGLARDCQDHRCLSRVGALC